MSGVSWNWRYYLAVSTAFLCNMSLGILTLESYGYNEVGLTMALRVSARFSIILFVIAFAISSLYKLVHNKFIKWFFVRRRIVGVAFAAAHAVHLGFIVALYLEVPKVTLNSPSPFYEVVGGGVGFLVIFAMVYTSFDGPSTKLGRVRWKFLHTHGSYYIWAIFVFCFAEAFIRDSKTLRSKAIANLHPNIYYYPFVLLLFSALLLRIYITKRQIDKT